MAELPPARRIVTGHTKEGKAIIEHDTTFTPFEPELPKGKQDNSVGGGFILLWHTKSFPAVVQGPWEELHGENIPIADKEATTVRIVDMAPGFSSTLHRTVSLDVGTVLFGEIVLEMDDGIETTMKAGETCIQRATNHAWHNRTNQPARMLFTLVPSKDVVLDGNAL
jgi:Cupin domain